MCVREEKEEEEEHEQEQGDAADDDCGDLSSISFITAIISSIVNLMIITLERYLKVVHPFWSKKHLKRWMIYVAMVFAWIAGILSVSPMAFVSTILQDGVCLGFFVWESQLVKQIINYSVSFAYSVVPVILFVYCYSRIVIVMRRQMRVMAAHNVEGSAQMSASQLQSKRIKWNITKTMIIVSVAFVICWFPVFIYFLVVDNSSQTSDLFVGHYATVFLSYTCTPVHVSM